MFTALEFRSLTQTSEFQIQKANCIPNILIWISQRLLKLDMSPVEPKLQALAVLLWTQLFHGTFPLSGLLQQRERERTQGQQNWRSRSLWGLPFASLIIVWVLPTGSSGFPTVGTFGRGRRDQSKADVTSDSLVWKVPREIPEILGGDFAARTGTWDD